MKKIFFLFILCNAVLIGYGQKGNVEIVDARRGGEKPPVVEDGGYGYTQSGIAKYNESDFEGAIADLTKAMTLNPRDTLACAYLSAAHIELKDYEEALTDAERLIAINPRSSDGYFYKGESEAKL